MKKLIAALVFGGCAAVSASAADGKWLFRDGVGTSPMNAANWSDEENWEGGIVPDGASDKADLSAAADLYIRVDTAVELAGFKGGTSGHLVNLIGDGSLTVPLRSYPTGYKGQYVRFYIHLISTSTSNNGTYAGGNCEYCGPTTLPAFDTNDGAFNFRFDRFATAAGAVREESPFVTYLKYYFGVAVYGPESLAESATSGWNLTAGSVYATPAGEIAHALPVGALVTGGGFPDGTFLKRTFVDGTIELSAPASEGCAATADLTFAAFTPELTVKVSSIDAYIDSYAFITVNKHRAEDALRVEVGEYKGSSKWLFFGKNGSYEAGEVVFKVATASTIKASLLNNGRIEFAGRDAAGTDAGIPNGTLAMYRPSGSEALAGTVVVTNGITATVGTLLGSAGTLTKEGAGTLLIGKIDGGYSGRIVVGEGTLTVGAMADGDMATVGNLDIAAGATYKLADGGLKVSGAITAPEGARIAGPGTLVLPKGTDPATLPIDDDVLVFVGECTFASIGYKRTAAAPAASPLDAGLPTPAIWMDVSRAETLITNDGASYPNLAQWNDVRDGGKTSGNVHTYATAMGASTGAYPSVITNRAGTAVRVSLPNVASATMTQWKTMEYSPKRARIRAIFKAQLGGGEFVGESNNSAWWRAYSTYNQAFIYNISTGANKSEYELYVNGEARSAALPMPYNGGISTDMSKRDLMVIDMHFADDGNIPTAGYIGYSGSATKDRNGGDEVSEILYYTNVLTKAQREAIRGYLMRKWMNGSEAGTDNKAVDACVQPAVSVADGAVGLPVANGREMIVEQVSVAQDGELVKMGGGTLYVNDLVVAGDVRVAAGTLNVKSLKLVRTALPGSPYLHVDASDTNTMDFVDGSVTDVKAWHDVRGAGYPVATVVNDVAGKYPKVELDACNGLPIVDFGAKIYDSVALTDCTGFFFPVVENLYSVYRVFGGEGGGVIAGYAGTATARYANKDLHTISRMAGGFFDNYAWWDGGGVVLTDGVALYGLGQSGSGFGVDSPGSARFRLDGVNCDPRTAKRQFSAGYQTMVLNGRDHIVSDALGCEYGSQGTANYRGGGQKTGEHILYTNALNRTSMLTVEAYLRKKWFGIDTPRFRPASAHALTVDAGATLVLEGGAPITASRLAVAGTIEGAVELAAGGEIDVVVADDGTIAPIDADGLAVGGGTIRLTGATRLLRRKVAYVLANGVTGAGDWQVVDEGDSTRPREYRAKVVGSQLVLEIESKGLVLLVR